MSPAEEKPENVETEEQVAAEDGEEPAAKKVKYDPVDLGPKNFTHFDGMFKYFSNILSSVTPNQDINEVML